jgi:hypothetical protein
MGAEGGMRCSERACAGFLSDLWGPVHWWDALAGEDAAACGLNVVRTEDGRLRVPEARSTDDYRRVTCAACRDQLGL